MSSSLRSTAVWMLPADLNSLCLTAIDSSQLPIRNLVPDSSSTLSTAGRSTDFQMPTTSSACTMLTARKYG